MDLFDAIYTRRSVRKYTDEPVPRSVLEKIVAAGIEAPTGCNMQLKQYVIVDDPAAMDKLRPMSRAIDRAAAAIILLVKPEGTMFGEFWIQDASAAMENMLLAAVGLGYAACCVEGAIRRCEDELREVLAVTEALRVWALLPVGRPAETPIRPPKPQPEEVMHFNRFGAR